MFITKHNDGTTTRNSITAVAVVSRHNVTLTIVDLSLMAFFSQWV